MRRGIGVHRRVSELVREREDLLRSLADLDVEFAAGDIAEEDYTRLRSDYVGRVAKVMRQIAHHEQDELTPEPSSLRRIARLRRTLGRRRSRKIIGALLVFWIIVGIVYASLHFAGVRLPGESETGSISLSTSLQVQQELAQATVYANSQQISQAVELYAAVLAKVPNQHQALTYQGWLIRISGLEARSRTLVRQGDSELAHAAAVAPGYPDARGLDGIALGVDAHNITGAIREFEAFHRDQPSVTLLGALGPQIVAIYREAGDRVPPWIAKYATESSPVSGTN